ncbi:hypothetical protein [Cellulomonas hominis]|nr:hypothetical protein [Cellulomonas hominis]
MPVVDELHVVSANGNDQVHVVLNLVREGGARADLLRDWARS